MPNGIVQGYSWRRFLHLLPQWLRLHGPWCERSDALPLRDVPRRWIEHLLDLSGGILVLECRNRVPDFLRGRHIRAAWIVVLQRLPARQRLSAEVGAADGRSRQREWLGWSRIAVPLPTWNHCRQRLCCVMLALRAGLFLFDSSSDAGRLRDRLVFPWKRDRLQRLSGWICLPSPWHART
jgi:hypothetical protein